MFRKSLGPGTDSGLQLPRVAAHQRCLTTCGENARLAPSRDRSQNPRRALRRAVAHEVPRKKAFQGLWHRHHAGTQGRRDPCDPSVPVLQSLRKAQVRVAMNPPAGTEGTETRNYQLTIYMREGYVRARTYTHAGLAHNREFQSLQSLNGASHRSDLHFLQGLKGRD